MADEARPVGRPREEGATQRILKAAIELGEEAGFATVTIEGIAARAGVGKTTIYRRWPGVWDVVVDAVLEQVTGAAPVLQLGSARESFVASIQLVAKAFRGRHGKLLRPLVGRAQVDESLRRTIAERWLQKRRELSREIIRRGIESGELKKGLDIDLVLDALYGPLYHRLLLPYHSGGVKLDDAYVEQLVAVVFDGIASGPSPSGGG